MNIDTRRIISFAGKFQPAASILLSPTLYTLYNIIILRNSRRLPKWKSTYGYFFNLSNSFNTDFVSLPSYNIKIDLSLSFSLSLSLLRNIKTDWLIKYIIYHQSKSTPISGPNVSKTTSIHTRNMTEEWYDLTKTKQSRTAQQSCVL